MFDSHHTHEHHTSKTVREIRAPTDASIKLYHEMLDKARAEVLASIPLNCNSLTGVVTAIRPDPVRLRTDVVVQFNFNGTRHVVHTQPETAHQDVAAYVARVIIGESTRVP